MHYCKTYTIPFHGMTWLKPDNIELTKKALIRAKKSWYHHRFHKGLVNFQQNKGAYFRLDVISSKTKDQIETICLQHLFPPTRTLLHARHVCSLCRNKIVVPLLTFIMEWFLRKLKKLKESPPPRSIPSLKLLRNNHRYLGRAMATYCTFIMEWFLRKLLQYYD